MNEPIFAIAPEPSDTHRLFGRYYVARIGSAEASEIVVEKHYLHRRPPISRAFGLVDEETLGVVGVVTYGVPPSHTLLKGLCGPDEASNVYELNRLWVSDDVPRNGESFLVSRSIRLLDKEIIVSFADTAQNHVGYIYQAANFIYTGRSAEFADPKVAGRDKHQASYKGMTADDIRNVYGAGNVSMEQRSSKHRYVYFNARGRRRAALISALRYETMPYPKQVAKLPVDSPTTTA